MLTKFYICLTTIFFKTLVVFSIRSSLYSIGFFSDINHTQTHYICIPLVHLSPLKEKKQEKKKETKNGEREREREIEKRGKYHSILKFLNKTKGRWIWLWIIAKNITKVNMKKMTCTLHHQVI